MCIYIYLAITCIRVYKERYTYYVYIAIYIYRCISIYTDVIYRGYIECSKQHSNVMAPPASALMAQVPIL